MILKGSRHDYERNDEIRAKYIGYLLCDNNLSTIKLAEIYKSNLTGEPLTKQRVWTLVKDIKYAYDEMAERRAPKSEIRNVLTKNY